MAITTAYDTLGQSGLTHALVETGAKAIVVDAHLLTNLVDPLKEAKEVTVIIYNDAEAPVNEEHKEKLQTAHPHLTILSWEDLKKLGQEKPAEPNPPAASDLACIMYTSGSTGTPKGVYIKQSNVVASGKRTKTLPERKKGLMLISICIKLPVCTLLLVTRSAARMSFLLIFLSHIFLNLPLRMPSFTGVVLWAMDLSKLLQMLQ